MASSREFVEEIGRGGFCVVDKYVLKADDSASYVAIKRLKKECLSDEVVVKRYQREARLLDDVLSHPNIVDVLGRNMSDDNPWFAMPVADTTLKVEIADGLYADEDWVLDRYRGVLQAMAYAHDKDVIHRDLKPANVLIINGVPCISDYGLGKHLVGGTEGLTVTDAWSGTEPYMAPEQFTEMKKARPQADVFALGKLLMIMLTGDTPDVGVPGTGDLPERYRYYVSRCCARAPENRYPDARAAMEAFARIHADETSENAEETLSRLIEAWWKEPSGPDLEVTKMIDGHLRTNAGEERMFTRALPDLPEELLAQYVDSMPDEFELTLNIYDGHVSGGLPFEYCDTVADFYSYLFARTSRIELRKVVLARLIDVGGGHNRFHVRDKVLQLLEENREVPVVEMACDLIGEAHPSYVRFLQERMAMYDQLPQLIKTAICERAED